MLTKHINKNTKKADCTSILIRLLFADFVTQEARRRLSLGLFEAQTLMAVCLHLSFDANISHY